MSPLTLALSFPKRRLHLFFFFFFNDPATPEIYTFPLPAALPIFEGDDPPVRQRLGHFVVDDSLRDPLHDRGLAHAGVADQRGVVLRAPRENLDRLLDLVCTADRKSTRLNSSHSQISYAVFCLKKK